MSLGIPSNMFMLHHRTRYSVGKEVTILGAKIRCLTIEQLLDDGSIAAIAIIRPDRCGPR